MKLTQILFRQHIGRHLKKHWMVQGKKVARETAAFKYLAENNIPVYDANDIIKEERTIEPVEIIGFEPKPQLLDKTHPNWHDKICLTYKDNNVLLEGFKQAQRITKTVEIQDGLPESYIIKNSSKELDARVRNIILNSHILDAQQEKLEKIKDPLRPAFNFPRVYGVSPDRRMKLLTSKLMQLIESMAGPQLSNARYLLNDVQFRFNFEKASDLMQFDLTAETFLTANSALRMLTQDKGLEITFPDLHPISDTITLNLDNIYDTSNLYPISKNVTKRHPHTIFIDFNHEKVGNVFEEQVTEEQIIGRSLLKTFTAAASYARQEFGDKVKELPQPVTVQCVHSDGRLFHFGVLQLNTLDLENHDGVRNIWYQTPRLQMFNVCAYVKGKPTLEGYNSDVIKHLISFYDSV